MLIRVDEIPEAGRRIHLHWGQERLLRFLPDDDPFPPVLLRPLNVDLEIQKRVDHIRIEGELVGGLHVSCHRCLEAFELSLHDTVDVALVPGEESSPAEEVELEARDLDYEFFDGVVIDLDQLVAEQVFLALPVKILCTERCRGLCPRCGANLNEGPCSCKRGDEESPFASLKAIRDRLG